MKSTILKLLVVLLFSLPFACKKVDIDDGNYAFECCSNCRTCRNCGHRVDWEAVKKALSTSQPSTEKVIYDPNLPIDRCFH